jgi:translocation and assembly module TamB
MKRVILFLLIVFGSIAALLLFVQSKWAKDKVAQIVQEMAIQQGMHLKIGALEGELPLKWRLTDVHLTLNHTDTLDIDVLRLRLSLFALLRGHLVIDYLGADHVTYKFTPSETAKKFSFPPLPIRTFTIKEFEAIKGDQRGVYSLFGHLNLKKPQLFLKVESPEVQGELFADGNKKELTCSLKLDAKSNTALAPFVTLPLSPFELEAQGTGPLETWKLSDKASHPIHGALKLHYSDLFLSTQFSLLSPENFDLHSLHLNGTYHWLSGAVQGRIDYSKDKAFIDLLTEKVGPFSSIQLSIDAKREGPLWQGTLQADAAHPELAFTASAKIGFAYPFIEVKQLAIVGPEVAVHGDITTDLEHLSGGVTFQLNNLAPISPMFGGKVGGTCDFQGDSLSCHALAKSLKAGPFLAQDLRLDLFATKAGGRLSIDLMNGYFDAISFESAKVHLTKKREDYSFDASADGLWKEPFALSAQGEFDFSHFSCNRLSGHLLQKTVHLEEPFTLSFEDDKTLLSNLKLAIGEGYFHSALQTTPDSARVLIDAKHFPLDFLSLFSERLTFRGLASCDIDLAGKNDDLEGRANFLLEQANILPAGSETPIQAKASLQANLNHASLQLHAHAVATNDQIADISLTLPLTYNLFPWHIAIPSSQNIAGQCTIEGNIEQLFDFLNFGPHRFGGLFSSRLVVSGTLDKPSLYGPIEIQQGFYRNDFIGLSIDKTHIDGTFSKNLFNAKIDAENQFTGDGKIELEQLLPFSLSGTLDHVKVIELDWLSATCSGPFTLSGNLHEALIAGKLQIDQADIRIPDRLPGETPTLPVTFLNQPTTFTPPPKAGYPFHYDLQVAGDHNIHLSGRGLESELGGHLHLTGKNLDPMPIGTLQAIKGNFYFAGRDFKISSGEIVFSEGGSFINMVSTLELPSTTNKKTGVELPALAVTLKLRGALRNPELTFESSPPLPTSALFARILFNEDVESLSPTQIVQLANTLMTLSSSSAPDFLGTLRRSLGIDRLSVSANENGTFSVEVGKSLSTEIIKGVAAKLTQGTEKSQIKVEVELKGGFILSGETQADDQGKISFKWNKNY